jgi:hypothetical protein
MKIARPLTLFIAFFVVFIAIGAAQDRDPQKKMQKEVASKTVTFATVAKTDAAYQDARDAHDLDGAHKALGQTGSFKGTVTQLFEERDGDLVILDFDKNYRTALTAIVRNADFSKFPVLKALEGTEIVVSGKFTDYQGRAQIELTDPGQIKLVR